MSGGSWEKIDLNLYDCNAERGFLPSVDPLKRLPAAFDAWEDLAYKLPKYLVSSQTREAVQKLPKFPVDKLSSIREIERAMVILSFIGHGYVWCTEPPSDTLPAVLAQPWFEVATHLGRPPVLSYASYALHNWERISPDRPVELGNIALLQNFLAGVDEEWFILIHVAIEAQAGPALAALIDAQAAVITSNVDEVARCLSRAGEAIKGLVQILARTPEWCDPYIYFNRVRPYIHGWKNAPALPNGVQYTGVNAYEGNSQKFRGETGAQSSIIPCLDACLDIHHADDPLKAYLMEMQDYMPPKNRELIATLWKAPRIRDFVMKYADTNYELLEFYNQCVTWVEKFRTKHLEFAASYIQKQSQKNLSNPTEIGTGGTPFMPYLKKHRDESTEHLLKGE
jgi:indoleamine 2,3-dioxygenase